MEVEKAFELTEEAIELLSESQKVTRKLNRIYNKIGKRANKGYYDYAWYGKILCRKPILDIVVLTLECYGFKVNRCTDYLAIYWNSKVVYSD